MKVLGTDRLLEGVMMMFAVMGWHLSFQANAVPWVSVILYWLADPIWAPCRNKGLLFPL